MSPITLSHYLTSKKFASEFYHNEAVGKVSDIASMFAYVTLCACGLFSWDLTDSVLTLLQWEWNL